MNKTAIDAILDENGNFPSFGLKPGEEVRIGYPDARKMNSKPLKTVVVQETGHVVIVRHSFHGPWGHAYEYNDSVAKASLYSGEHELFRVSTGKWLGRCNHECE